MTEYTLIDRHHIATIPNMNGFFRWEADLISVTRSGYIHAFEVKTNKADYKRDFRKKKHDLLTYNVWSPNYFWYAIYGFDVDKDSLPENYGLIVLENNKNFSMKLAIRIVKDAKMLHRGKMDDKKFEKLCTAMSWRILNMNKAQYLRMVQAET